MTSLSRTSGADLALVRVADARFEPQAPIPALSELTQRVYDLQVAACAGNSVLLRIVSQTVPVVTTRDQEQALEAVWRVDEQCYVEVPLSAELLAGGADALAAAALDPIARLCGALEGDPPPSLHGRYRTRRFAERGRLLGLEVVKDLKFGHRVQGLTAEGRARLAGELDALATSLDRVTREVLHDSFVGHPPHEASPERATDPKYFFPTCGCSGPRGRPVTIRISSKVYRPRTILCEGCGEYFSLGDEVV